MKRTKVFVASRGSLEARSTESKSAAKVALEQMIDWALQYNGPYAELRFGCTIVVAATCHGWQSTVMFPGATEGRDACWCLGGQGQTREETIQRARQHAAQGTWEPEMDDESYIAAAGLEEVNARELRSWIGWQRRYIAAKADGRSNTEAFNLAGGMPA